MPDIKLALLNLLDKTNHALQCNKISKVSVLLCYFLKRACLGKGRSPPKEVSRSQGPGEQRPASMGEGSTRGPGRSPEERASRPL